MERVRFFPAPNSLASSNKVLALHHRIWSYRRATMNFSVATCIQILVASLFVLNLFTLINNSTSGDLGFAVKKLVDDFQVCFRPEVFLFLFQILFLAQSISRSNKNLESIEDIQRFVESFPEFRVQSGAVSKHVTILTEASHAISFESPFWYLVFCMDALVS